MITAAGTAQAQLNQATITTAVPIMTLSPDARASALGEAGVATSPDANAAFFNPGKLGFVPYKYAASLSYSPWLRNITDDMSLSYLSGYGKVGERSAFGASLMYFDLGTIDYRTGNNLPAGSFSPKEYAFTASYGLQLTDNLGVGVSARYIRSNLVGTINGNNAEPGNAAAVDLGAYYTKDATIGTGVYNLAFGAAIANIGNKITYTDPENPSFLPTTLRLGTAITREIDQYNKITLVFDATKLLVPSPYYEVGVPSNSPAIVAKNREIANKSLPSAILGSFSDAPGGFKEELREINLSSGLEYNYNNLLYARGGYFYEAADKGDRQYASLGLGVRYQVFGIDGAYLIPTGSNSQNNPLAQTIRISLHFNLNKLSEAFDEQGAGGTSGDTPTN
ncbi:MAG TPA: type IX secretion system outer membrane channel protein PorV [Hymenobacter sp.]